MLIVFLLLEEKLHSELVLNSDKNTHKTII